MASLFGRSIIVPLTNKSGGGVVLGDVVVVDTTTDESFTTTTSAANTSAIGVAAETIANNASGRVIVGGYASLVNVNASVTRNQFGTTHTVAKQAVASATRTAGTFCRWLKSSATPSAYIYPVDLSGVALTNPMTTRGDVITGGVSGAVQRVAVGSALTLLSSDGTDPSWGVRIIYGRVNADGTTAQGTGFSASKTATGRYTVTFTVNYATAPAVIVSPYVAAGTGLGFVFSVPAVSGFNLDTTSFGGSDTDKAFSFIAIGV